MLLLLTRGIYGVHGSEGLRWHDMHTEFHDDWFQHYQWDGFIKHAFVWWYDIPTKFHEDWFRHSANIKVIAARI
jgi:hypothetical protein